MDKFTEFQDKMFNIFIITTYSLLILSAFGVFKSAPIYLENIDYYVKIYICLFLIWRFNPIRSKIEFTNLDRKIAFSAGLFILTTTVIKKYILFIKEKAENIFTKKN
jgi:hypothetical protein